MTNSDTLYCYIHPDRETLLRCNTCEKPICTKCAVLTPTGYRCRECVRGQQKVFETAKTADYILAPLVAGGLSFLGSLVVPWIGFFTIFLAPIVGTGIGEIISRITGRRRSKRLFYITTGAVLVGALFITLASLLTSMVYTGFYAYRLIPMIYQIVYALMCAGSVFYRLSGIRM
jgi:hypothetical protein